MQSRAPGPIYHVLLIGIDSYTVKPLTGCVNDIDAIQRLLLDPRVGVRTENITRLASPHPDKSHDVLPGEQPATLANIRTAFRALGAAKYTGDHRVLIYYSGHGMRAKVSTPAGGVVHRESLVPVDFNTDPSKPRLLYDFEINALLAAITGCGASVTIILDCCHSAGQMRDVSIPGMTPRTISLEDDLGIDAPIALDAEIESRELSVGAGLGGNVDDCHVVAACLSHEQAQEARGSDALTYGLLTRALVAQFNAIAGNDTDLRAVQWGQIWQALRADVETANPLQHLWMAGSKRRAVLAGPRADGDAGLTVTRPDPNKNEYTIAAGTLAAVTKGAQLAVYGLNPAFFSPLDSPKDNQERHSQVLLEVTDTQLARATAKALGAPFDLPEGARARLVKVGKPARLRCAVVPPCTAVVADLAKSPLLEVVDYAQAPVRLRRRTSADIWDLVDEVHGVGTAPPLFSLLPDQLDLARTVMEQYFYYALPLRMAHACPDLDGGLQLSLLRCPTDRVLSDAELDGDLPEAPAGVGFDYALRKGDPIVFCVRNRSFRALRIFLLNAAASGRVQLLGNDSLASGARTVFWRGNTRGKPFLASIPTGAGQGIDRLVVIGTTSESADLGYLELRSKFADLLLHNDRGGIAKDFDDEAANPPTELWTAAEIVTYCKG